MPDHASDFANTVRASDTGECCFRESNALLECLRAACNAPSPPDIVIIATTLDLVMARMTTARLAFDYIAAHAGADDG